MNVWIKSESNDGIKSNEDLLLYQNRGIRRYVLGKFVTGHGFIDSQGFYIPDVSHWMKLPEPPDDSSQR